MWFCRFAYGAACGTPTPAGAEDGIPLQRLALRPTRAGITAQPLYWLGVCGCERDGSGESGGEYARQGSSDDTAKVYKRLARGERDRKRRGVGIACRRPTERTRDGSGDHDEWRRRFVVGARERVRRRPFRLA